MFKFQKFFLFKTLIIIPFVLFSHFGFSDPISKLDSLNLELKKANHDTTQAKVLEDIAKFHSSNSNYKKSIEASLNAKKIYIKLGDDDNEAAMLNAIGAQYYYLKNWGKSIKYFSEANQMAKKMGSIQDQARYLNNIGLIYDKWGDYDKAVEYHTKSLIMNTELENDLAISSNLNNLALIYTKTERYDKAIEFYKKSLTIKRKFNQRERLSLVLQNIAWSYYKSENHAPALKYAHEALEIAQEDKDIYNEKGALTKLGDIYDGMENYKMANQYIKLANILRDSLNQMNNTELIAEMDAKYEAEKKDNEIALQQVEIGIQNAEVKLQSTQKIWFAIGLLLSLVLLFVAYRSFKQKKKANLLLEEKNTIIEEKNKDITDSITYASSIQQSILPDAKQIAQVLPEHLIFYKPKDIVSGDFYWFHEKDDLAFIMAADCTGHGVPGAFVSMLCNNVLNQVIIENDRNDPGEILTEVNRSIITSFRKKGAEFAPSDGMDCSLCVVNKKTKEINFAGAYNQLVIVNDGELKEIKADRTPIGGRTKIGYKFKSNNVKTHPNDTFYIFSDGYADQFGGPKGKKFMIKSLKQLFIEIHEQPMKTQYKHLDKTLLSWVGDREQIDDILIVGFKI